MDTVENPKPEKVMVTMTVDVEVDPMWVEHVTGGPEGMCDVFLQGYSGYWMEGIDHDEKLGWLAYEFAAEDRHCTKRERAQATSAWKAGQPLPKHFHALNLEAAKKTWVEGAKKYGMDWFENGDGISYDCAVQLGLLGDVVYG